MPPLGSLRLSRDHAAAHGTPAAAALGYEPSQAPNSAHETEPPRQAPCLQRPVQSPAETTIQSWTAAGVQQPQPMTVPLNPKGEGIWSPAVGIKFGGGSGGTEGQGQANRGGPRSGTWDPRTGIRFG